MEEDYKVFITRHSQDGWGGEISISEIERPHWDNCSGGVRKRQGGYSLYGYIDYGLAASLVKCSGMHGGYGNSAKICIPASCNRDEKYRKGYKELVDLAGDKPRSETSFHRPQGAPPCTKRIFQIVSEKISITRGELRDILYEEGYYTTTIRNALRTLIEQKKIVTEGSAYSPKQKIKVNM